jgi:hypothetical protein
MRNLLIAAAAGLMTLSALPVSAATTTMQARPYTPAQSMSPQRPDDHRNGPGQNNGGPGRDNNGPGRDNDQYGRWDSSWGARPAGPPRSFSRHNDWYRHVRACSQRYRSYDARTDRYVVRRGQTAVCRL